MKTRKTTSNLYKVTDSRQAGKAVIRFASAQTLKQVKTFLYEERQIASCYIVKKVLNETAEADNFMYKEVKLDKVANFLESHFMKVQAGRQAEAEAEARKQEAEERKQEAEAEDSNYYYDSLSSYMKEAKTAKALYTPIHKMLTAYARDFYATTKAEALKHGRQAKETGTDKEGIKHYEGGSTDSKYNRYYNDYMKLSANGLLVRTAEFDSYANAVYAELLTLHKQAEAVNTSFSDECIWYDFRYALKKATDKGIYNNFHSLHGKLRKATITEAEAEAKQAEAEAKKHKLYMAEVVVYDSFPANRQETLLHYLDKYNTEAEALKRARIREAKNVMTDNQYNALRLTAIGYTAKEAGKHMKKTAKAVERLVQEGRNRAYISEREAEAKTVKKAVVKPCKQFASFAWNRQEDKEGYSRYLKQAEADINRRLASWYEAEAKQA